MMDDLLEAFHDSGMACLPCFYLCLTHSSYLLSSFILFSLFSLLPLGWLDQFNPALFTVQGSTSVQLLLHLLSEWSFTCSSCIYMGFLWVLQRINDSSMFSKIDDLEGMHAFCPCTEQFSVQAVGGAVGVPCEFHKQQLRQTVNLRMRALS